MPRTSRFSYDVESLRTPKDPRDRQEKYVGMRGAPVDLSDLELIRCQRFSSKLRPDACRARWIESTGLKERGAATCAGCPVGARLAGRPLTVSDEFVTLEEAARALGCSATKVYSLYRAGKITGATLISTSKGRKKVGVPRTWVKEAIAERPDCEQAAAE